MDEPSSEPRLRVNKITLFSHGVASLELSAQVQDDAVLHLSFSESHMNDVLKSLTVVDTTGGQIASISYEAPSQSAHTDAAALSLDREQSLTSLLQNAQGASVAVLLNHGRPVTGTVLGMQWLPSLPTPRDHTTSSKMLHVVLLKDGSRVVKHDLNNVSAIDFLDDLLQKQLARCMRVALASLRAKNNKLVTISTKGAGQRIILANYAVESPVYKLTYRFLLKPRNFTTTTTAATTISVQGWAIIDNPCDEDLDNVDVTIVSGLPISFRHDLYGARFVERPEEQVPTAGGPGYTQPSQATFGLMKMRGPRARLSAMTARRGHHESFLAADSGDVMAAESKGYGGSSSDDAHPPLPTLPSAEASEIGDLFEYNLPSKVTLKARESALVPLIMRECEGGSVDIYSHDVRPSNTLSAVRIKNTTDATLEGGPVSVYEQSRLVGEGMMKPCRPGSEQFLPYSVDLDCIAEMTRDCESGQVLSTIAFGGYFRATRHREFIRKYIFRNNKLDDIDIYILHSLEKTATLDSATVKITSPPDEAQSSEGSITGSEIQTKPSEVDATTARYRITVPSGHMATLRVIERTPHLTTYDISTSCSENTILNLQRTGVINKNTAEKMREIMKLQVERNSVHGDIKEYKTKITDVEASQGRFRQNLESLGGLHESSKFKDSPLIEKYISALSDSEANIEANRTHLLAAEEQYRKLEAAIQEKLQAFSDEELR